MNEAVENVCVKKNDDMMLRLGRTPVRPRCHDGGIIVNREPSPRSDDGGPVPTRAPGDFVVDLLSPTGPLDREEAGLLLSWLGWVEAEAREADLLEGLDRLRGAVMNAVTAVGNLLAPNETHNTGGGVSKSSMEAGPEWTRL
jgi:hypothetical protein